ncbi:TIR domain-containing protein [Erythrobacter gaetbuli]|uniref:TIR domain-containing protein n=1 Tax=Qipengyuania gaetbuli TaxID=266952 RepID=A0A844XX78_9SPHN|nr:TIR domain-containing protein [Qipengyuania gaetbuli]MXO49713.1 TIR domain-containing protein [Qipengyuania gaetbuli]
MSGIFISYARADERKARLLAEMLRLQGYTVWRDDQLPAHRAYAEVIEERLRDAEAVVALWSSAAARSQWVRAEADTARQDGKLVQVTLDGAQPPLPFNQIHCLDMSGWDGKESPAWHRLLATIEELAEAGEPVPKALPRPAAGNQKATIPSIAVLPFKDLSPHESDEYFADGIVEEIATVLSRFNVLFVLGASTSRVYRDSTLPLPEIALELGVRYLLVGSVRRASGRVRIAVSLIDGEGGAQVWAGRFDDELEDVFELQDRIANSVASAIDATIEALETRRAVERPTSSPSAYELFLRANAATMSWDREDMEVAIEAAEEALRLDPKFAWAAVILAMSHAVYYNSQWDENGEEHREKAHRYLDLALRLRGEDTYVLAHGAGVLVALGEDLPTAERLIGRALEVNPGSALTRLYAGWTALAAGRPEEGIEHFEESLRLDPHSARRYGLLSGKGLCLVGLGRLDEAHMVLSESLHLAPDHSPGIFGLTLCLAAMGRPEEARTMARRLDPPSVIERSLAVVQDPEQRATMQAMLAQVME